MHDVLPVDQGLRPETIRRHVLETAERLEAQLGPEEFAYDGGSQREIEAFSAPAVPITVGLDGGYVRGRERLPSANGYFEVIAGKSIPQEGEAKVFAFAHRIDRKPKRRLRRARVAGHLALQHITFLCDGGHTVRELSGLVHPRPEHILDWFHVAMRIEQLLQTTRGLQSTEKPELLKGIERVKWFLWHGNVIRADETLYDLLEEVGGMREQDRQAGRPPSVVLRKLDRALEEFATYVDNNAGVIVNYGKRYRCGERISTGFVESAVNQVIAKRFVKKQQMRWTPRGAHLLLQVHTQVQNDELDASFEKWYPGFGAQDHAPLAA